MISQSRWKALHNSSSPLVALLLATSLVSPRLAGEICGAVFKSEPYNFAQEDAIAFLRAKGMNVKDVTDIRRDSSGTKLFVLLLYDRIDLDRVITIVSNGINVAALPGSRCYFNSEGDSVAWFGPEGRKTVHFKNGELLLLGGFDLFDVDPSGKYFVVGEKPNSTWLGQVASPTNRVRISSSVLGTRVFVSGERIYVCGNSYKQIGSGYDTQAACLIVEDVANSFRVRSQRSFEWASGIVDVDPFSARLLLWDKGDELSSVYLYDFETNRRHRIGVARRFQFFLTTDLLGQKKSTDSRRNADYGK